MMAALIGAGASLRSPIMVPFVIGVVKGEREIVCASTALHLVSSKFEKHFLMDLL